jgi:hypothetical protein
MKPFILIFVGVIMTSFTLSAQSLLGKVIDKQSQPIGFANVALYSLPDSVLITGTITDEKGEFLLNTDRNSDNAFLKISFMGYETQTVPAKPQQTVVLTPEAMELDELVVKGDLPKIRLRDDAIVASVQNSMLSKAGTGNDVLKRLPSLTGDNGEFSVFGKGQAIIYINNREMRDVSELDNLNSTDIKDVEIVNNPGARYDASVKAVIRINTVRKTGDGFSFDVRSSYWQSQNTNLTEQINLNYRRNGWDVFSTLQYNRNASLHESEIWQKTYVDTLWTQENTQYSTANTETLTGVAGINYEISPKHSAGMKYTLSLFPSSGMFSTLNSTVLADGVFYDKWTSEEEKKVRINPDIGSMPIITAVSAI